MRIILLLLIAAVLGAAEINKIAIVNLGKIQQEVGYEAIAMLRAEPKVVASLKAISTELAKLRDDLLAADTVVAIGNIKERMSFLEQKYNYIKAVALKDNDGTRTMREVIATSYKGKYLGITENRNLGYDFIDNGLEFIDITDEVIASLRARWK